MRTIYIDYGEVSQSGPLGIFSCEVQILYAGTVLHTEQAKVRAEVPQYQEMAERAGIYFFFEDEELPEIPFYAVPSLELVARDREGNWYGRAEDLGEGVYCVTPEGAAFRVSERMGRFSACWRGRRSGSCGSLSRSSGCTPPRRRQPGRWSWSRRRSCCQRDGRSGRDEDACHHRADERAGPDRH